MEVERPGTLDENSQKAEVESLNVGELFVGTFRWLVLLMFAVVLKRGIEGVFARAGYPAHSVMHQFVDFPSLDMSRNMHRPYIGAFIDVLVLLLFAVRYSLCLVDPIERAAGLALERQKGANKKMLEREVANLSKDDLRMRLKDVRGYQAAAVLLLAVPEFGLLVHAGLSVQWPIQWLTILGWLVVWDTIAFSIGLPALPWALWLFRKLFMSSYGLSRR